MEQVPQYSLVRLNDGISEKLQISVKLPGVQSTLEFSVKIQDRVLKLHVPGRFKLDLALNEAVEDVPEELKFVKSRSELKAILVIADSSVPIELTPPPAPAPSPPPAEKQAKSVVHDSFLADAAKLVPTKRKSKPAPAKKAAADPAAGSASNPNSGLFEEWERPKRRTRTKHKPTLAGFVKSPLREKAELPVTKESDSSNAEQDGSIETPTISGEPKASRSDRESEPEESNSHFPQPANDIPEQEDMYADLQEEDPATRASSEAFLAELLQGILDAPIDGPDAPDAMSLGNDGGWTPHGADSWGDSATLEHLQGHVESRKKAPANSLSDYSSNPWLKVSVGSNQGSPASSGTLETEPASSRASQSAGARLRHRSEQRAAEGYSRTGSSEPVKTRQKPRSRSTPKADEKAAASATPRRAEPARESFTAKTRPADLKTSQASTPTGRNTEKLHTPRDKAAKNKKKTGKQHSKKSGKLERDQLDDRDDMPAFHPPPPPEELPSDFQARGQRKADRVVRHLILFCHRHRPAASITRTLMALAMGCLAACIRLYFWAESVAMEVAMSSPDLLPELAAQFRWTRLQKVLQTWSRQSQTFRYCLGASTLAMGAFTLYYGVVIAWGLCSLAISALLTVIWLLLLLIQTILWRPTIYVALPASLSLRYMYKWTGPIPVAQFGLLCWGGPMTIWGMGGGLSGLLTLAVCLLATLWDLSHIDLIIVMRVSTAALDWLGLALWMSRPLTLAFSLIYLVLRGKLLSLPSGKRYSEPLAEDIPEGAEGEIARVLLAKDFYEVLDVSRQFEAEDLRRAKRKMSLATHPDKHSNASGAGQAFSRVTEAYDVLSVPKTRAEYDQDLRRKALMEDMEEAAQEDLHTNGIAFFCPSCGLEHHGKLTSRKLEEARYCSQCKTYHPAQSGDTWHEASGFFNQTTKMYLCVDNSVWDMTEWANCAVGLRNNHNIAVNTHDVPYRFGKGFGLDTDAQGPASQNRKKAKQRNRRR